MIKCKWATIGAGAGHRSEHPPCRSSRFRRPLPWVDDPDLPFAIESMPTPPPSGRLFFRGEMTRMFAMLGMLVVIGLLIAESRKASMWRWLEAPNQDDGEHETTQPPAVKQKNEQKNEQKGQKERIVAQADGAKSASPPSTIEPSPGVEGQNNTEPPRVEKTDNVPAEKKDESAGVIAGTDLDPDEWKDAVQDFEPIQDATLEPTGVEMKAYWRVLHWVDLQSLEALKARTKGQKTPSFRDLTNKSSAELLRGKLYKIDLHVIQIMEVPVPKDNPLGKEKLYELYGVNQKSGKWMWCGVTDEIPPGMKIGSKLEYDLTFHGYFFKIQGYQARDSAPNSKLIRAPLLMGRIEWQPPPPLALQAPADTTREWILGGAIVGLLGLAALLFYLFVGREDRNSPGPGLPSQGASDAGFAAYLEQQAGNDLTPPATDHPSWPNPSGPEPG